MTDRPTAGIVRSVRRMLEIVVSMAKTRIGLLAVEARLELHSIWLFLALTVLALIFVAMFLLMLPCWRSSPIGRRADCWRSVAC